MKKAFKLSALILGGLLIILLSIPFLFKGKIIEAVKKESSAQINGTIQFGDIGISLLKKFPKLTVSINDFNLTGIGVFENDTLISTQKIELALDIMSVIKGDEIEVYEIALNTPRVFAYVNKDGLANWNIIKPSEPSSADTIAESPFKLSLKKYKIVDGYISYLDEAAGMKAEVTHLNHEGTGNFTNDLFVLKTSTLAKSTSFSMNGIPYLHQAETNLIANIEINNKTKTYSLQKTKVAINNLSIESKGHIQSLPDSSYRINLSFDAPDMAFKDLLSLIPAIYKNNFASLKTSGIANFKGKINGVYGRQTIPSFEFDLAVKDGFFQYPELPAPVKNISFLMNVRNEDGISDHTEINLSKAHIEIENNPVDFRLFIKNPITDLYLDAAAKGTIDFSRIKKIIPLSKGTNIKGIIHSDLAIKGRIKAMQQKKISAIDGKGILQLSAFHFNSPDYPTGIILDDVLLKFNPANVTLQQAKGKYLESNFSASGYMNNLINYLLLNDPLEGSFQVSADKLWLNQFINSDTAAAKNDSPGKPFIVPSNLNLSLKASVDHLVYDKINMDDVSGSLSINNETVTLKEITGNAFDGKIKMHGYYSTRENKEKPEIALTYDVKNVDIKKAFFAVNTASRFMPAGKFMSGKMNSQFSIKGSLEKDMMPALTSLTGNGNLFLIDGVFKGFQPVDKLASSLNVEALKDFSMKNVQANFEIADGKVLIKPFKFKVENIDIEAGGLHGVDQSLFYTLYINLPRTLIGNQANTTINGLISQASSKGLNFTNTDVLPLKVDIRGFINKPEVHTDLRPATAAIMDNIKQQTETFIKAKADSAKQAIKDSVVSVKNQIVQTAKDELIKNITGNKNDSSSNHTADPVKKLEETGKGLLKGILKKN